MKTKEYLAPSVKVVLFATEAPVMLGGSLGGEEGSADDSRQTSGHREHSSLNLWGVED